MSRRASPSKPRIPWLALVILVGSIVFFWVLPNVRKQAPVRVEFTQSQK